MYVCNCNGITDKEIDEAVADVRETLRFMVPEDVFNLLGIGFYCGRCKEEIMERLNKRK